MRKKTSFFKLILLVIIVAVVSILFYNNFKSEREIEITKWDNIYNEENIVFFYEDNTNIYSNESLKNLDSIYRIKELTSKGASELEKVLKSIDILNSIIEYDDVADRNLSDGYEILKDKKKSKKVTGREMAVIARDIITCAGYKSRIGEFRVSDPQLSNSPSYYVVEYFSEENDKWVMIDFRNRAYYSKGEKLLSSIEILNSKFSELKCTSKRKSEDVKEDFKKFLSSYTIYIDNTTKMSKSNSCLTYISSTKDIDLKKSNIYISPTIYTENTNLFLESPYKEKTFSDEGAYLILMKKQENSSDDVLSYVVGAFMKDSVINNYYLRVNNGEWKQIKSCYYDYDFKFGESSIELSLDGKNVISEIKVDRKE